MGAFEKFKNELKKDYDFEIFIKEESYLMILISKVLFFNKKFMSFYITTIGKKIYFPKKYLDNDFLAMEALAHELVHLQQNNKYGKFTFSSLYLFPQILVIFSLLAVLAFVNINFLWCLLFLVCAAPFPSYFRKKFEHQGYTMTLFIHDQKMRNSTLSDEQIRKRLVKLAGYIKRLAFRSSAYYYMWPFKLPISFDKEIDDIRSGVISDTDDLYVLVKRAYVSAVSDYDDKL